MCYIIVLVLLIVTSIFQFYFFTVLTFVILVECFSLSIYNIKTNFQLLLNFFDSLIQDFSLSPVLS